MIKKILKWTGILLLVIIILAIATPFIFKDKIIAKVKEEANNNLNAKVDFRKFDLTLFSSCPDFTFSINDVSVVGVKEFEGDTVLTLKNLTLSLNLMSVIKGSQYQVRTVSLDRARIFA